MTLITRAHCGAILCLVGFCAVVCLAACKTPPVASFPGGAVSTSEQAIAVADKDCGYGRIDRRGKSRARWGATLEGDVWTVRADNDVFVQINARDGKPSGCLIEVH